MDTVSREFILWQYALALSVLLSPFLGLGISFGGLALFDMIRKKYKK